MISLVFVPVNCVCGRLNQRIFDKVVQREVLSSACHWSVGIFRLAVT